MFESIIPHIRNKELPSGINSSETAHLVSWVKMFFLSGIPKDYIDFLMIHNGFIYNGHCLFCILNDEIEQKFIKLIHCDFFYNNKKFAQGAERRDYLILGKSDVEYLTYSILNKQYEILTNDILDKVDSFTTFELALLRFLSLD